MNSQAYIDFGVFSLDDVLSHAIDPREAKRLANKRQGLSRDARRRLYAFDGTEYFVNMTSERYWVFKDNPSCVVCGRTGSVMVLQRDQSGGRRKSRGVDRVHFNMYAVEPDGTRVLMTKDHVIPRSCGGRDHVDNYQTMCTICNGIKGDLQMTPEQVRQLGRIRNPNH